MLICWEVKRDRVFKIQHQGVSPLFGRQTVGLILGDPVSC